MYYDIAFGVISPDDEQITPTRIDELLAEGYFRHARNMASYEMMYFEDQMNGVLPLRCALTPQMFTKSQRKKINQTLRKFNVEITPLNITPKHIQLYKEYRLNRFEEEDKSLIEYFGVNAVDELDILPYNTWQISFWENDQLIAASFFDVGDKAISSLMAIYDYDYKKDGLGFISMLIEMNWALENNHEYYYPGYTLDLPSCFDYKLRLPNVAFYDWESKWHDWGSVDLESTKRFKTVLHLERMVKEVNRNCLVKGHTTEEQQFFGSLWHNMFDYTQAVEAPIYGSFPIGQYHQITLIYLPDEGTFLTKPHLFDLKKGIPNEIKTNSPEEIAEYINAYFAHVQVVETRINQAIGDLEHMIDISQIKFDEVDVMGNASRHPNFKWVSCKKGNMQWMIMPFWDEDRQQYFYHPLTFKFMQNRWVSPFGLCTPEMALLKISHYIRQNEEFDNDFLSDKHNHDKD
ncbi:hypothetical protein [Flammeovirga sp. SJP92]|uniref:hypothetical protein n=1 Tax=Flammeovirga sp. SJP92 TaxID=1775430 RepID=UPI000788A3AE|nr:hypothetical protein [Flammeovirga sp. SJP92]KXX67179.1 hypothetical protein AVL50_27715 [Flammeovirga sp. SJP92]